MLEHFFSAVGLACTQGHEKSMEAIDRAVLYIFFFEFWILNIALRDDDNDNTKMCAYVHLKAVSMPYNLVTMFRFYL